MSVYKNSLLFLLIIILLISVSYAHGPAETISDSLKNSNIDSLSALLSKRINISMTMPRNISGIYSRQAVIAIFSEIFSEYETVQIMALYTNHEKDSVFIAYEWTLKKNNDIIVTHIFFSLEMDIKEGDYSVIRITNIEK